MKNRRSNNKFFLIDPISGCNLTYAAIREKRIDSKSPTVALTINKILTQTGGHAHDWELALSRIRHSKQRISIESSGTTGAPRKIEYSIRNLIRHIQISSAREEDIWGLTYPLDRFSGLQVFFQAFMNHNTLVNLANLTPRPTAAVIDDYGVTHLSGTPTYYRLLMGSATHFETVRQITCSGEPLDRKTYDKIRSQFPNAKITNIYATSEFGSLLTSRNTTFKIPDRLLGKIKIDDDRLLVREDQWATKEKTDATVFRDTGDRVKVIAENPLMFHICGRADGTILVAGNNVDPLKIERLLESIAEVAEARVFGKSNSVTGELVACEIALNAPYAITKELIKKTLQDKLNPYEIPRIILFVNKVEKTPTGKKVRR